MTPTTNNQMPMQRINWRKNGCVGLQVFIIRFLNACIFDEVHVMLMLWGGFQEAWFAIRSHVNFMSHRLLMRPSELIPELPYFVLALPPQVRTA